MNKGDKIKCVKAFNKNLQVEVNRKYKKIHCSNKNIKNAIKQMQSCLLNKTPPITPNLIIKTHQMTPH